MLRRWKLERGIVEIVDTESLTPNDHLLRKVDAAVNWERIYDIVEDLYSDDMGRPGVDPLVLIKMVLLQHLYGLPSLRRLAAEVRGNIYYRWFLGYSLNDEMPHFSTISYNFRHRFTEETVEEIFRWILEAVSEAGYLTPEAVFIDGTHIKANANIHQKIKEEVSVAAVRYSAELLEEINSDREAHGKKPLSSEDDDEPKPVGKKQDNTSRKKRKRRKKEGQIREVTQSTTDLTAVSFGKENTSGVLLTRPTQPVRSTALSWT